MGHEAAVGKQKTKFLAVFKTRLCGNFETQAKGE
jgi:hypothetical protein